MKIRSPDYYNLQALNIISTDHYLADVIASLGTADFVLGSIDRKVMIENPSACSPIKLINGKVNYQRLAFKYIINCEGLQPV